MGLIAQMKSVTGRATPITISLASGDTVINIPSDSNNFFLSASGSVTIATINASTEIQAGRIIHLTGATGTSSVILTNNDAATTKGQMDLDGANITIGARDVITLIQRADGAWDSVAGGATGELSATEVGYLDGVTPGTVTASKALIVGSSKEIASVTSMSCDGTVTVTSANAAALAVGLAGATDPAFVVDASTGSQAAGLKVTGATAAGNVAVAVISSGAAANLLINAKGTGTIGIGSVSTGAVTITPATTVTGALTPSAGVVTANGYASPRNVHTCGIPAIATTSGTNSATNTTTTIYLAEVFIPCNMTVTGVAIFNGTAVAGNGKVMLFSVAANGTTGTRVAISASTAMAGTTAYQLIPFTTPYAAKGPATYFVGAMYDTSTHDLRGHVLGTSATGTDGSNTYETESTYDTITCPTTFTADIGPIASLY